jgi:hypothetical protein
MALVKPRGQALVKVAGGRVIGTTECPGVGVEGVAEPLGHVAANVNNVDARTRTELEVELDRR